MDDMQPGNQKCPHCRSFSVVTGFVRWASPPWRRRRARGRGRVVALTEAP